MSVAPNRAADALNRRFFMDHPVDAARKIEDLPTADIIAELVRQPVQILVPALRIVTPESAAELLLAAPDDFADQVLAELPSASAIRILGQMSEDKKRSILDRLPPVVRADFTTLLAYRPHTVGRHMNTHISVYRREMTVGALLKTCARTV